MTARISYIATDLEFDSSSDLSGIVEEFGDRVSVHLNEWIEKTYRVCLQVSCLDEDCAGGLEGTLSDYCSLIESLSAKSKVAWNSCSRRVLDIAFESGTEPKSRTFEIPPELFRRISGLGITLSVTLYQVGTYSHQDRDDDFSPSSFQKDGMCGCGQPERMASDPNSPVSFNETLNQYYVESGGGSRQNLMYFCFFCGGKMPKSKCGDHFTHIDDSELEAAMDFVSKIETVHDIFKILGEPDSTHHFNDLPEELKAHFVRAEPRYRDEFMFAKNWTTLQIHIRTYDDGHFRIGYLPKPLQEPKGESGGEV